MPPSLATPGQDDQRSTKSPKIQRWIDLLAALLRRRLPGHLRGADPRRPRLRRRRPVARDPPPHLRARQGRAPRLRHPHRDHPGARRGDASGYRLRPRDFYLPYLTLRSEGRAPRPEQARQLRLPVPPDPHLRARRAGRGGRCRRPGPRSSAIRSSPSTPSRRCGSWRATCRWTPRRTTRHPSGRRPGPAPAPELLATLGDALDRRKRVTFSYHTMGSDADGERTVEPFGLFFLNQHWYLAARAPGEEHGQELPAQPDRRRAR